MLSRARCEDAGRSCAVDKNLFCRSFTAAGSENNGSAVKDGRAFAVDNVYFKDIAVLFDFCDKCECERLD